MEWKSHKNTQISTSNSVNLGSLEWKSHKKYEISTFCIFFLFSFAENYVAMIGREKEQQELLDLLDKDESQFCAVYGRRRVGKTFLVRETFDNHFTFSHTGIANAEKEQQLAEFKDSLKRCGAKKIRTPKDWFEAFHLLERLLEASEESKKVVFIDELPWMDTTSSNFVSALEHFWNGWANMRKDIVLVVCGSATSWIMSNIVMNHGGLYGRLTSQIFLKPFTLHECEAYAQYLGLTLSRKDLVEAYMILGGVPFYWSHLKRGESLAQNVDRLFFDADAKLVNEFDALYRSLFKFPTPYVTIVSALATRKAGMTREEILAETKLLDNDTFIRALRELEQCGFIRKYTMLGRKVKGAIYQLMDNFTLFYFQFLQNGSSDAHFWSNNVVSPRHNAWAGLAFERVCLQHLPQIKQKLGILGVACDAYSWNYKPKDEEDAGSAFQIDLLIDRNDNMINLCEMKFSTAEFEVSEAEEARLRRRLSRFVSVSKTKKSINYTLVTTYGLVPTKHSHIFQQVVVLEDLFKKSL